MFKHAIQVLNDGDVSNKVFTARLYFVLLEVRMKKISTECAQLKMEPTAPRFPCLLVKMASKKHDKVYVMLLLPTTSHSNTSCISIIPLPHFTNINIKIKETS